MALGSIPFTVSETAGVNRQGALLASTLSSMRHPIAVPLRFDEAKTSASTFRVIDDASQVVPAAFRVADVPLTHAACSGGARWGDYGNTSHRIKMVLIDMLPTLAANTTRTYQLQTSGGTGSTPGSMVSAQAAFYEINTGTGGITCRVPRTGPMSIIRYLKENTTNREIINGDGGGLWMRGIAGAPSAGQFGSGAGPANNQGMDFFSNLDTSGDGSSNGGDVLEAARPTKYFTSIYFANSQVVCIKIDTIRCVNSTGQEFKGMNRFYVTNSGTITSRPVTWDVYLYFYRNSAAIRRVFLCKSSGSADGVAIGQPGSAAIDGMGVDLVTTFTGSMQAATRDETAATKVGRVTSATAKTVRQLQAPTAATYGMSLSRTGDFPASTGVTQLEAFYSVSDGLKGLVRIPWAWRERFPMGWEHTPSAGRLRWEMLNPDTVEMTQTGHAYHIMLGPQWYYGEEWLVAHTGALTDTQITDTVKALAGRHEQKHAGVWSATPSQTAHGAQNVSLLGQADADHWDDTRIWRRIHTQSTTGQVPLQATGAGGLVGLPSSLGLTTKWDDLRVQLDKWADALHDDAVTTLTLPTPGSYRGMQARTNARQHWNHKVFGDPMASGGFGPNEYEACSVPIYPWLTRNDRGDFQYAWEATVHLCAMDQWHSFPQLDPYTGAVSDIKMATLHVSNAPERFEYQQNFEAPALLWLLTGEPLFLEAMIYYMNFVNQQVYAGAKGLDTNGINHQNYQDDTGTMAGGVLTIDHPERWKLGPAYTVDSNGVAVPNRGTKIGLRPANQDQNNSGNSTGTLRSEGNVIINSAPWASVIGGGPDEGNGVFQVDGYKQLQSQWVGSIINVGGTEYTALLLLWGESGGQTVHTGNGSTATFAWSFAQSIAASTDIRVIVGGATKATSTYTVSGVGATSGTVTFLAGNIPTDGQQIIFKAYVGRRMTVTPAPSPALNGQTGTVTWWAAGQTTVRRCRLVGFSGNQAQMQFEGVPPIIPADGAYTVHPWVVTFSTPRGHGWPLAATVAVARCLGRTVTLTAPLGVLPLYQMVHDGARFMAWWEQFFSHPDVKANADMPGNGVWGCAPPFSQANFPAVFNGWAGTTHTTIQDYAIIPVLTAHEFGVQYRTNGIAADVFTTTFESTVLNQLDRWVRHIAMGRDGLSPSTVADTAATPPVAERKIPMGRGAKVNSPTSYLIWNNMYEWAFTDEPTRTGKSRSDFWYGGRDLTSLTNTVLWTSPSGAGFGLATHAPDVMAYVAEKKFHATGDFARRDLWLRMAREIYAGAVLLCSHTGGGVPLFGGVVNPNTYPPPTSGMNAAGGDSARFTVYHSWRLKHGGYLMRLTQDGFPGGPQDTTDPTETALLAEVSKTDTQITVEGPAATDNVGVVGYRFFKAGVQDGADQIGLSHIYIGLTPNTPYTLTRRAFDAAGNESADSNTLNITTLAAADTTPPTVPVIDGPRTVGTTSITYTWPASTDTQSSVLRYRFSFDGAADVLIAAATLTFTVLDLTPGTLHTGKVSAEDTQGNISAYSAEVSDTTLTSDTEAPSAPGTPILVSRTSVALTVTWTLSTDNAGVQDYRAAITEQTQTVTAPPATFTGLDPFTTYPVTVLARDAALNESPSSPTVDLTTLRLARVFNGTNQLLRVTALAVTGAYPVTVGIKFYPTVAAPGFLWSLANHLSNDHWLAIKLLANGTVQALRSNATGFSPGATSLGTYTLNAWNRVVAVFASDTLCTIRLNNDATAGEDVTLKAAPTGVTREAIGGLDRLNPVQYYIGRAADRALWTAALDAVEQGAFLSGASAWTIRRQSFVSFVPFYLGASPEPDLAGPSEMTLVNAPTTADGPEDLLDLTDPVPPGPPQPPTDLLVTQLGASTVTITFTQGADSTGTRVRRADTSVVFELADGETTFVDNGLLPFTPYSYTFAGTQSTLESAQTTAVDVTTKPTHSTAAVGRQARSVITPRD